MVHPTCQIKGLDEIYHKYFGTKKGFFCEVGAHDGFNFSNTWGLAKEGWRGLYIEPITEYADKCREVHKLSKVDVLQAACSDFTGEITLYKGQDIYSANGDMVTGEAIVVPCYTLDRILLMSCDTELDLLVIDVEYHEKEVLQGLTLEIWNPKMVIIEAHENHENKAMSLNADFINDYFKTYKKIYSDTINNIYVR